MAEIIQTDKQENLFVKIMRVIYNTDVYRCVIVLLLSLAYITSLPAKFVNVELLFFHWGYILLIWDIIYKRKLFRMKQIWMLFAFLAIVLLSTRHSVKHYNSNMNFFLTLAIYMLVMSLPGNTISTKNKYCALFTFCIAFLLPMLIMSAMSIWAQVTQQTVVLNGRVFSGTTGSRLAGGYGNPNTAGVMSFCSIAMSVVCLSLLKCMTDKFFIKFIGRVFFIIVILIQMSMLVLSGSRASMLALLTFTLAFSFFTFLRVFSLKLSSAIKGVIVAVPIAFVITGLIYYSSEPIRIGVAYIQAMVENIGITDADIEEEPSTVSENIGTQMLPISRAMTIAPIRDVPIIEQSEGEQPEEWESNIIKRNRGLFEESGRDGLWLFGLGVIRRNPLFGVSQGGLADAVLQVYYDMPELAMSETALNRTIARVSEGGSGLHNIYIQVAAIYGVPALVLFILYLSLFAIRHIKELLMNMQTESYFPASGILALCAAILLWSFFETGMFYLYVYVVPVIFWSCLSFAGSLLQTTSKS